MTSVEGPLRIALFTGNYNCIVDGVTRTLHRVVAYLERKGHGVLVFGPRPGGKPIPSPGTVVPVPALSIPGRSEYRISLGLRGLPRKRLEDFAPHIIHIATPDLLGHGALAYAIEHNIPAVSTFHTHFSSYLRYYGVGLLEPLFWKLLRRFYARCRHVFVPSTSMIETLKGKGFTGDLRLWARGVDTELFNPRRRSDQWRRGIGLADDEVVVLFVSRLVREKGVDVFVEALAGLRRSGLQHRSLVVGDGPEMGRLRKLLPGTIFTGHLEGEGLARAYASADVFVFPSVTETFGNVTLEALASGLPVVCAVATGSSSLVEDGRQGFLAPPKDLVGPLGKIVGDANLRRRMGAAAREHALGFDWEEALDRLMGFYRDTLTEVGGNTPPSPGATVSG